MTQTAVGRLDVDDVDVEVLRDALLEANIPTLLMVLVQLTGDRGWLAQRYRPVRPKGLDDNDSGGLEPQVQQEIRDATLDAIVAWRQGRLTPADFSSDQIAQMTAIALGEPVSAEYGDLLAEELGQASREVDMPPAPNGFHVLIIGAGISGLCAAIKLKAAGVPFTVIEKNNTVGGTWLENTYPGCGVDTPGHLYSFSFDPNLEWTRYFAKRDEVWQYLERLTDKHGLRDNIEFGLEVATADYDADDGSWVVVATDQHGDEKTFRGSALVPSVGMVNRPSTPDIAGLDSFAGPIMHTAAWDSDVDVTGKRVTIIGTGASAMQLVPSIAEQTKHITIFQRSKQWTLPHPNYQREVSPRVRTLMEAVPYYAGWYRLRAFWNYSDRLHPQIQVDADWPYKDRSVNKVNESHRLFLTKYIEDQLADRPDLIPACLPDYPPYGKRPLVDNGWFQTIKRDDVELVTDAIERVEPHAIIDANGVAHDTDIIVLATGFKTLKFLWPMQIRGRSGTTLAEQWGTDDARAFLGLTVPDFPNMFILNGPNTNAGHGGSAILATEFQVRYLMQALRTLMDPTVHSIEVRDEVFWNYNKELDEALRQSVWAHPGMTTYYRNDSGRVVLASPWTYLDYWKKTRTFEPADYLVAEVQR